MNTDQIRRGLRSIQTRAETIDALIDQGAAAIGDVLPLLQDRDEGVRWSAIRILSEIGDNRVIGPLITLLEQSKNVTDAANALRSITGQDLGDDPAEWRNWAMRDAAVRNVAGGHILSDRDLVMAATRDLPVTVQGDGQQYSIEVSLPGGHSQAVWIDLSRKDTDGRPMVQLCTPCGTVDPRQYEAALKLNMAIPCGAIAIAALDDALCFVIVDSYLRETVHPEDMAASIMSLARYGDSVQKSLAGDK